MWVCNKVLHVDTAKSWSLSVLIPRGPRPIATPLLLSLWDAIDLGRLRIRLHKKEPAILPILQFINTNNNTNTNNNNINNNIYYYRTQIVN